MVPDSGASNKTGRVRRRGALLDAALFFALVFTQALLATIEVMAISKVRPLEAGFWAALNAGTYIAYTYLIIDVKERKLMMIAYVLACSLATVVGVLVGKFLVDIKSPL